MGGLDITGVGDLMGMRTQVNRRMAGVVSKITFSAVGVITLTASYLYVWQHYLR